MVSNATLPAALIAALSEGDEALDRGLRGPGRELDLLREAGFTRAPLPQSDGGKGWGTTTDGALAMLDILAVLGGASLPVARIYEGHVNAIRLVVDHGTPAQKSWIAEAVINGAALGVWGADSDTPVSLTASNCLIGTKAFASGLGDVSIAVITARCALGIQMVLADVTDARRFDYTSWNVTAMVGSRSGQFDCSTMPVGEHGRLGNPDALYQEPAFHGGIWRLVACYAGAMRQIACELNMYAHTCGIADDPLMRHRLGETILEAESARVWAHAACLAVETGLSVSDDIATVLFAREATEQAALRQMATVERAMGTSLHQTPSKVGRIVRNLRFYLRQAQLDGKLSLATSIWCTIN